MQRHLLSNIYYLLSIICRGYAAPSPICRSCGNRRKNGFTLVELLVVIAIIGILATIAMGSAQHAARSARQRRVEISCRVLETAILRYKTEYNEWPGSFSGTASSHVYEGSANASVFGMLRVDSDDNPDKIQFLDETAFYTEGSDNRIQPLSQTSGDKPLVYQSRDGKAVDKHGKFFYYKVTINYEDETVAVSAPDFNDEDE